MKKPLAIIWNDAHLKTGNEQEIMKSVNHLIAYGKKNKISDIIFAGDLFDSRSFQRQEVLRTFDSMLDKFHKAKMTLYLFPGNHDKTVYEDSYSFLDVYRFHPGVKFNRELKTILIKGVSIDLLPFFSDDLLVPMIKEAKGGDILISHFEMNGSTNLGRVSEKGSITRKMLSKWKKTYLGHYHNTHEITKDIVHLPSLVQANFGEDSNKGFTVLNDDLSYSIVKGHFREFTKIVIDVDTITAGEIKELITTYKNSEDIIRFEFIGDEAKLKAINREQFKGTGIDVKIKFNKVFDYENMELPEVIQKYDKETVKSTFHDFCEEKGFDYEIGKIFLDEFLEKEGL